MSQPTDDDDPPTVVAHPANRASKTARETVVDEGVPLSPPRVLTTAAARLRRYTRV